MTQRGREKKRVRLTKNRLHQLNMALSLDDVLYERFQRLNDDLHRREIAFARKQQLIQVRQQCEGNVQKVMEIQAVHKTPAGLIVIVR